jgi:chromosome segregation ATPase
MLWLIPVGIGVIGFGLKLLSDIVSEDEHRARSNWQAKRVEVQKSLGDHQANIETHINRAQSSYDFHFLTDLHYSSMQVANAAYKLLDDAKKSMTGINKMLASAKHQRGQLQQTLETARANKDKALIHDTIEQLKMVDELRKSVYEDRETLQQERERLLAELQQLNNRTRELKELIKNRCGNKGSDWYRRLEARKQQKRLAQGHA